MLRITIHDGADSFRFQLEGRLVGAWVREVEQCWRTAASVIHDKRLVIDLRSVQFVDPAGKLLLSVMHQAGAEFIATTPLMKALISEIKEPLASSGQRTGQQEPVDRKAGM